MFSAIYRNESFFFDLDIPINYSPNALQNITANELITISPVMKIKLLPIPNTIKQRTKAPTINALFLFLNKSLILCSWDKSFFLLVPSMKGIRRLSNHFLKAFMGFILNRGFHIFSSWSSSIRHKKRLTPPDWD